MQKTLVIFLLTLMGCSKNQEKPEVVYFDLSGLVLKQITVLNQKQPQVKKTWKIGTQQETKVFEKTDWAKELDVFIEADINKSGLKNSYWVKKNENLELFKLKDGENAPIKYLLVKKTSSGQPLSIELESGMNNFLFKSKTKLRLDFEKDQLKSFEANGFQKLFFGKADSTKIRGVIL